jgi:hypothetical protein
MPKNLTVLCFSIIPIILLGTAIIQDIKNVTFIFLILIYYTFLCMKAGRAWIRFPVWFVYKSDSPVLFYIALTLNFTISIMGSFSLLYLTLLAIF